MHCSPPSRPTRRAPRAAGFAPATYGALLAFISDGGGGDLRRLGVQPGDVVAYAAPGGSAVAAVAFLRSPRRRVAAPLDAAPARPTPRMPSCSCGRATDA